MQDAAGSAFGRWRAYRAEPTGGFAKIALCPACRRAGGGIAFMVTLLEGVCRGPMRHLAWLEDLPRFGPRFEGLPRGGCLWIGDRNAMQGFDR